MSSKSSDETSKQSPRSPAAPSLPSDGKTDTLHAKQPRTDGETLAASYEPHAAQVALHDSQARFTLVCAGRRAGKTYACAVEFLHRIYRTIGTDGGRAGSGAEVFVRRPRRCYQVLAPSYELLREPQRYIFDCLTPGVLQLVAEGRVAGWRAQERRLWLPGDAEIQFRTAEDPLMLVGARLDGVWLDEVARMKADAWQFLRPALSDAGGWMLASTTPLGRNWVYDTLHRRGTDGDPIRDPEYASISWPTASNPHIDPAEIAQARRDLPATVFRREYEASFAAFEGQVYEGVRGEEFEVLRYREVVAGIDWGYAHAGAVVVVGVRADGVYDVLDEAYAAGRPLPAWVQTCRELVARWNIRRFYADPSAPMLITEMRRAGPPVVAADNDVWEGIQAVQSLLHRKQLRVHARCKNLLREMEGYAWQRDRREGALREEPAKHDDDACDALRYALREQTRPAAFRALR